MTDLKQLHEMVWEFRKEMADHFPTPDVQDSLRFALTEAVEALDAMLRMQSAYKRNNDKEHSIPQELAQCAVMLLTACDEGVPGFWGERYDTLDAICFCVADALHCYRWDSHMGVCGDAVLSIDAYLKREHDTTLEDEMQLVLHKFRMKHHPTYLQDQLRRLTREAYGGALLDVRR